MIDKYKCWTTKGREPDSFLTPPCVQYGDAGGISDNSKIKRDYLDDNLDFDRGSRAR